MNIAIISLLAVLSLVTCEKPPTGPEFEIDPKNPLHRAILDSTARAILDRTGRAPDALKRFKPALDELVGRDRSVASYERILTREGATCRREGAAVRCTYRKIFAEGFIPTGDEYFDFDLTIAPQRPGNARARICVVNYSADAVKRGKLPVMPETVRERQVCD